jgi:hypothetical protein
MPKATIATSPPSETIRRPCLACNLNLPRAHAAYSICTECAANLAATRARVEQKIEHVQQNIVNLGAKCAEMREALSARDRDRWNKIVAAKLACTRQGRHAGTATQEQRDWLKKVQRVLDTPGDTRLSDAIRRCHVADEMLFWAQESAADEERRLLVVLGHLDAYEEAVAAE